MVILKKIRASTLIETLVATVLIIVIFIISSAVLNNVFSATIKNDSRAIENHLHELQYLQYHNKIELPYNTRFKNWTISVDYVLDNNQKKIQFYAKNEQTNKEIVRLEFETQL